VVNEKPIRVVMADDHAGSRTRMREALEAGGFQVCGEGATAEEAVNLALRHKPDVALLDVHMPGNGIQAARTISRALPQTAIVMLSQFSHDEELIDSLRAGVDGYLLKDTAPVQLSAALSAVMAGEAAIPRALVSRILDEFRAPNRPRFQRRSAAAAKLTAREWEVMEMLGEGRSTEEVGQKLYLSPTTVRVHVSTVLRKLRVKDRESAFRILRSG
jgi:DNA-binding NarL/FixJ family response regulator